MRTILKDELLENVGHKLFTFTLPKMLRPFFMRHRELLSDLARLAYETIQELMSEVVDDPNARPGVVAVPQTFGSLINPHPHPLPFFERSRGRPGTTTLPPSGPKIPKESSDSHATCCVAPFLSPIHWTKGARTLFYEGKSFHHDPFASDPRGETLDLFEFLRWVALRGQPRNI